MTSLTAISHLMQVHTQVDELRQKLNDPMVPLTNEQLLTVCTQLQPLYKKLLLANLDDAVARQLEQGMWGDCFKTPLTRFGRMDKNMFYFMIEAGVGFYLGLIQDIGIHFDISFITNTTSTNKLYCTKTSHSPLVSPSKASVYYIIQNCLLHVGDLLRYQGSFPEGFKMYDKSSSVCPSNGLPYHQMGVTQLLISANDEYTMMNNFVAAFYYHSRALAVANPHIQSYNAFDTITAKILGMPVGTNKYQEFIRQFLLMISTILRKDLLPSSFTHNVVPMLSPLVANQQIKSSILFQMICIAMWTQWRLMYGDEGDFSPNEETILEILAAIFNAILIAAVGLFNDALSYGSNVNKNLPDRRMASTVHIKLIVDWLVRLYQNEKAVKQVRFFRDKTHMSNLVKVLNLIKATPKPQDFDDDTASSNFILPEEKRLIAFLPLDYSNLRTTGAVLLDEACPKTQIYRLHRLIQTATALSHSHSSSYTDCSSSNNFTFLTFDGTEFGEMYNGNLGLSPHLPPNRRNVALTSIFRSGLSSSSGGVGLSTPSFDFGDGNSSFCSSGGVSGGISPTNSNASLSPVMSVPYVSNLTWTGNGNHLGVGKYQQSKGAKDKEAGGGNSNSDPFRSIWTPAEDKQNQKGVKQSDAGASAWN